MKMAVFWVVAGVYRYKFTIFTEVRNASVIDLMVEAVQTSETSVNLYQSAWHCNPEDSHLHTHRRENLKSNKAKKQLIRVSVFKECMMYN
jgi:stress response protein YsnF